MNILWINRKISISQAKLIYKHLKKTTFENANILFFNSYNGLKFIDNTFYDENNKLFYFN